METIPEIITKLGRIQAELVVNENTLVYLDDKFSGKPVVTNLCGPVPALQGHDVVLIYYARKSEKSCFDLYHVIQLDKE